MIFLQIKAVSLSSVRTSCYQNLGVGVKELSCPPQLPSTDFLGVASLVGSGFATSKQQVPNASCALINSQLKQQ